MRGLEVAIRSQNSLTFRRLAADVARQRTPMRVGRKEAQRRRHAGTAIDWNYVSVKFIALHCIAFVTTVELPHRCACVASDACIGMSPSNSSNNLPRRIRCSKMLSRCCTIAPKIFNVGYRTQSKNRRIMTAKRKIITRQKDNMLKEGCVSAMPWRQYNPTRNAVTLTT